MKIKIQKTFTQGQSHIMTITTERDVIIGIPATRLDDGEQDFIELDVPALASLSVITGGDLLKVEGVE